MLLLNLAIGGAMIALTIGTHALFMVAATSNLRSRHRRGQLAEKKAFVMIAVVLWFFLAICLESWMWALLYQGLGAIDELEDALYFATVTYSTLGYGDVVLGEGWRLLSAFSAANGAIVLGWTTALVFLVAERLYGFKR